MTHSTQASSCQLISVRRQLALVACLMVVLVFGVMAPGWSDAQISSANEVGSNTSSKQSTRQSTYLIGPPDVLQISVWKEAILSREVIVRPDGFVSFPLIGEVLAEGRTSGDLAKHLAEPLRLRSGQAWPGWVGPRSFVALRMTR